MVILYSYNAIKRGKHWLLLNFQ